MESEKQLQKPLISEKEEEKLLELPLTKMVLTDWLCGGIIRKIKDEVKSQEGLNQSDSHL